MEQEGKVLLRAGGDLACRFAGDIAVLRLKGRLDLPLANTILDFLKTDLGEGPFKLVLNFDRIAYISSAGVSLLLRLSSEHEIRIVKPREEILGILGTVGIQSLLAIDGSEEAAVQAFVSKS